MDRREEIKIINHLYKDILGFSDSEKLDILLQESMVKTYKKGEVIIYQDEIEDKAYFIYEGIYRLVRYERNKELTMCFAFNPGDVLLSSANSINGSNKCLGDFELIGKENGILVVIGLNRFVTLYGNDPEFFRYINRQLTDSSSMHMELSHIRTLPQVERVEWFHRKYPSLENVLTNKIISSFLNIDQRKYGQLKKEFEKTAVK
ncbi:MAG: hypothetical protein Q4E53_12400 [Eubacteriales bacterium]|nr:hypothetical protein [Eubacteriales bacterium]